MTSWDALEAYLSDLVRKVGGVSYVLRDSRGRQLAPRRPSPVERAIIDTASLERVLERIVEDDKGDNGDNGDRREELKRLLDGLASLKSVHTALQDPAGAVARSTPHIDPFRTYSAVLDEAVGADFVRKGPGKRYMHREAPFPFIAERFLSSYLLIIAFRDAAAVDAPGVVLALERARSVISDMLEDLPPDDGGDRALSQSQRPS